MKQIESVIFDAGGVLHENNTAVTQDLMNELGLSPDAVFDLLIQPKIYLVGLLPKI